MTGVARTVRAFRRGTSGAVAVEVSLLISIFLMLLGGGVEMMTAYHQKNSLLQAARAGARLAATHPPVAVKVETYTGLGGGVSTGDPLPHYDYVCRGDTRSCSSGAYRRSAMDVLVFGPNGSNCVNSGNERVHGMCVFADIEAKNVEVRYRSSGLGTAGNPADPLPLITVTVSGVEREWVFLQRLLGRTSEFRPVSVTVMAEGMGRRI